ncbi:MAG: hypothetical protein Q7T89_10815, partial [Anaerolineales bacterium]|nr:hypothetical protein [Anaerolineales bacterium]
SAQISEIRGKGFGNFQKTDAHPHRNLAPLKVDSIRRAFSPASSPPVDFAKHPLGNSRAIPA